MTSPIFVGEREFQNPCATSRRFSIQRGYDSPWTSDGCQPVAFLLHKSQSQYGDVDRWPVTAADAIAALERRAECIEA